MSAFINMFVDMLPVHSELQKPDNQVRKVLDKTVGEYMDNTPDIFNQLFVTSATGGWLDAHGRDYGVTRKINERDEDYRQRIIFEKLDHLTVETLTGEYGLELYCFDGDFTVEDNVLVSDNPYMCSKYMCVFDAEIMKILTGKFVLDSGLAFIVNGGLNYVIDSNNAECLSNYGDIYGLTDCYKYFHGVTVKYVKLDLENCISSPHMFLEAINLLTAELNLPNVIDIGEMFLQCVNLETVKLNAPNLEQFTNFVGYCGSLTSMELTVPEDIVTSIIQDIEDSISLANFTSLIINGEEYIV